MTRTEELRDYVAELERTLAEMDRTRDAAAAHRDIVPEIELAAFESILSRELDRALERLEAKHVQRPPTPELPIQPGGEARTSGGNPNHDAEGKFASSPGGGHGKHHARRQRRKQKLRKLHKAYRKDAAALKAEHKAARVKMVREHKGDKAAMERHYRKKAGSTRRRHVREKAQLDRQHAREVGVKERVRERERATEAKQKAKGKVTDEQIGKWEADHAEDVASLKEIHAREKQGQRDEHDGDIDTLKHQRKQHRAEMEKDQRDERKDLLKRHRGERQDLMDSIRQDLRDNGFKKKGEKGERSVSRRSDQRGVLNDRHDRPRSARESPLSMATGERLIGIDRRFNPGRTHKASSAEAILRHCLRKLGFTAAFRRDELTGEQRLTLLEAIREYGKAWFHHEASDLFRVHGRKDEPRRSLEDAAGSVPLGWVILGFTLNGIATAMGIHWAWILAALLAYLIASGAREAMHLGRLTRH